MPFLQRLAVNIWLNQFGIAVIVAAAVGLYLFTGDALLSGGIAVISILALLRFNGMPDEPSRQTYE